MIRHKSCIILVRMFNSSVGDSRTRFLDIPMLAQLLIFLALLSHPSLESKGLDFSKAFMSNTTNIIKGVRSGVQKLIKKMNIPISMMLDLFTT